MSSQVIFEERQVPGHANLPIGASGLRPGYAATVSHAADTDSPIGRLACPGETSDWHNRGYLPHFDVTTKTQHVTFHLADSLPKEIAKRFQEEIRCLPLERWDVEWRKRVESWIDSGYGSCVLQNQVVAEMVQNAFFFSAGQRYRLLEWVVMPNHVHVLFQPINGWSVAKIVASWKKFTARGILDFQRFPGHANLLIGESPPPVWHREYWDRFIRDERHFQQAAEYIRQNPVKAGLAKCPEDWRWSSAFPGHANLPIGASGLRPGYGATVIPGVDTDSSPIGRLACPGESHDQQP